MAHENLVHLKRDRTVKIDEASAILNKAEAANRELTADEQATWDACVADAKALKSRIERLEQMAQLTPDERQQATDLSRGRHIEVTNRAEDAPFRSFGEQVQAIITSTRTGRVDPRLLRRMADGDGAELRAISGMSETVPSDGGFFVQKDFATELIQEMHEQSMIAPQCREIPISEGSNGVKINGVDESSRVSGSRWGGVVTYWEGEGDLKVGSKPKFRRIELDLKKLTGLCYMTDELMRDAAALEAVTRQAFAEEIAYEVDDKIIAGTGAGQPLGIINSPSLVTVSKESGQSADTFLYENAVKMYSRLTPRSASRANWYINQEVFPQLFTMSLTVGTGGQAVWLPAGGAAGTPFSTLLSRPVIPIEQAKALGDVGDIILGDFSQYVLATKGAIETAVSIHVRFLNDETVLRFVYRVDGQPYRKTALTPANGTATIGPFVVLEAR